MDHPLPKLGRLLRMVRKKRGIKIKDLKDDFLSDSAISRIEHGKPVKEKTMNLLLSKLCIEKKDLSELLVEMDKEETRIKLMLKAAENKIELNCSLSSTLHKIEAIDSLHPYAQVSEYLKARICLTKRKWVKAREHFQKAIKLANRRQEYLYFNTKAASFIGLGYVSYKLNNIEEAIKLTNEGIESFVLDGEKQYCYCTLLSNKATYLEKLGKFDEVYEVVQQILPQINELECKPSARAQFYQLEGNMLKNQNQLLQATEVLYKGIEYAKVHKLPSSSATLWTTLGDVFCEMKELEEAEDCYQNALELNNSSEDMNKSTINIRIYNKLTHIYIEQGKWEDSHSFNQKTLKLNETNKREYIDTLINLSRLLFHDYDYENAIQALDDAVAIAEKIKMTPDSTMLIRSGMKEIEKRREE